MNKIIHIQIDADNVSYRYFDNILMYAKKFGSNFRIKVFGNFSGNRLQKWKMLIDKMSLQKISSEAHTGMKNATDSLILLDSLQLSLNKLIDKLILVSSDGDFTNLAKYCKTAEIPFIVLGPVHTAKALIENCDIFHALS
ncbi:MAG: NYN domain-containing protein [Bacteroidetes bacterium]|nr:NYN domain-containing protein [Bacteroidota bacterium]